MAAKLVKVKPKNVHQVIELAFNAPKIIGRNPALCAHVLEDNYVSGQHCELVAVRSPNGGVIVSCRDISTNGITVNDYRFNKKTVILTDGDILGIPGTSLEFACEHTWKDEVEERTLFETIPQSRKQKTIGRYIVFSHRLGAGSSATVHLAVSLERSCQVACKTMMSDKKRGFESIKKEVGMLAKLDHPNINHIYDLERDGNFINVFLELCTGGDLFTYISGFTDRDSVMEEHEVKYIMYQLFKAVEYLHDQSISHRDLKPENILLHAPGPYPRIIVGDFGFARPKSFQETLNVSGTLPYLPPEGILALDQQNLKYIGMPSDCWSSGIILYIMLTGVHPFDSPQDWPSRMEDSQRPSQPCEAYLQSEAALKKRILDVEIDFSQPQWGELSQARDLIMSLLTKTSATRATIAQTLSSSWIVCGIKELEELYRSRILNVVHSQEN